MTNINVRLADAVRESRAPAVAAFILQAVRHRRAASNTDDVRKRAFHIGEQASALVSAVQLVHGSKGLSCETVLRIATDLAERTL